MITGSTLSPTEEYHCRNREGWARGGTGHLSEETKVLALIAPAAFHSHWVSGGQKEMLSSERSASEN